MSGRSLHRRTAAAGAAAALIAAVVSGFPAAAVAADLAARIAACGACHAAEPALPNMPSLAAQPETFLETQLVLIREGVRDVPAMKGVLDGMSDAELSAIAKHYAAQPVKPPAIERDAERIRRGAALAERTHCASCHAHDYAGRQQVPRLAAQREDYLLHSMRQFRDNEAIGRDTLMSSALYGMTDEQLADLAHYLATLKPPTPR